MYKKFINKFALLLTVISFDSNATEAENNNIVFFVSTNFVTLFNNKVECSLSGSSYTTTSGKIITSVLFVLKTDNPNHYKISVMDNMINIKKQSNNRSVSISLEVFNLIFHNPIIKSQNLCSLLSKIPNNHLQFGVIVNEEFQDQQVYKMTFCDDKILLNKI